MSTRWLGACALFVTSALAAHPHALADQQANLSVTRSGAVVTYYIQPSASTGDHMFDHIDINRDGKLSRAEMAAFARELEGSSRLAVDNRAISLAVTHFAFPDRKTMAAGQGVIRVKAQARFALRGHARHRLAFAIDHARFARSWSIQPFFSADLARSRPTVTRPKGRSAVLIKA